MTDKEKLKQKIEKQREIKTSVDHPFKCAFFCILFSTPVWAALFLFFINNHAARIVLTMTVMVLFVTMAIALYMKDYYEGDKK